MNHRRNCEMEGMRLYVDRSYILTSVSNEHFDALNFPEFNHGEVLNGYCLDALRDIPGGSTLENDAHPMQTLCVRGKTTAEIAAAVAELRAMVEKLIYNR